MHQLRLCDFHVVGVDLLQVRGRGAVERNVLQPDVELRAVFPSTVRIAAVVRRPDVLPAARPARPTGVLLAAVRLASPVALLVDLLQLLFLVQVLLGRALVGRHVLCNGALRGSVGARKASLCNDSERAHAHLSRKLRTTCSTNPAGNRHVYRTAHSLQCLLVSRTASALR